MAVLFAVALFALPAYLGHAWALTLSPFVFLAAGMELIITTIFRAGPLHYWVLVCGLVWCGAELALAKDLKPYLREQRGDV